MYEKKRIATGLVIKNNRKFMSVLVKRVYQRDIVGDDVGERCALFQM